MVAELVDLEAAGVVDAAAERGDERPHLGRAEHAVEAGALDVEDLALEREDGLKMAVAPLLGAAAGALSLDDVELALLGVFGLAVGELARERGDVERALADDLARLAGRLARLGGDDGLVDDLAGDGRRLFEELAELVGDRGLDDALDLAGDELRLGLRVERGVGVLDAEHAGETLADVFAGEALLQLFEEVVGGAVAVDGLGERRAQAGEVRAAVLVVDVVGVAVDRLLVGRVPLHGHLDRDGRRGRRRGAARDGLGPVGALARGEERDDALVDGLFRLVEEGDELGDAAAVEEACLSGRRGAGRSGG